VGCVRRYAWRPWAGAGEASSRQRGPGRGCAGGGGEVVCMPANRNVRKERLLAFSRKAAFAFSPPRSVRNMKHNLFPRLLKGRKAFVVR